MPKVTENVIGVTEKVTENYEKLPENNGKFPEKLPENSGKLTEKLIENQSRLTENRGKLIEKLSLDTNLDTSSVTSSVTNSVTGSVTSSVTSSVTWHLSDKQKEVLAYCIIARSSREIFGHIDVIYHHKNIVKFINTLVEAGLLERTIPDAPNSPRQKYVARRK